MKRWLLPATAAALACAAYVNALHNPFVYDDHDTVVANPSLVDVSNLKFVFLYSPFRPVVNVSYAIDRALWGYEPLGFHLTNVLLHVAVVLLVYALARRVLADAGIERGCTEGAFAAAALFAVHPMQTEAVAYVSGRSEVLCAVWFLAAMVLARDAMASGSALRGAAACVCGALAIASKEVGLVLPVMVVVYDWLLRPGDDDPRWRRLWRIFVPGFVVASAVAGYRLLALPRLTGGSAPALNGYDTGDRHLAVHGPPAMASRPIDHARRASRDVAGRSPGHRRRGGTRGRLPRLRGDCAAASPSWPSACCGF